MRHLCSLTFCVALSFAAPATAGQDAVTPGWTQWGGPSRDFHVASSGLKASLPGGAPKKLWQRPLGDGYSAILSVGDWLYTMYREGGTEVVVALAAANGETRWEHRYPAPILADMNSGVWVQGAGTGPYSTPLVLGDTLYAVGVSGKFHALDRRTGKVLWSHDLDAEFGMSGYSAYAPSPVAHGGTIILPVGGRGQAVVAFDQRTGVVVWKNQDFALAPSSPLVIDVDGQQQLVVFAPQEIVGLDPSNGRQLWRQSHPVTYGLNISMPVWGEDNLLFCSSAYGGGSRMLRLSRTTGATAVEEVWYDSRLRLHFGNAVRAGNVIVFTSGDFGPAFFVAVDALSGKELWRERTFARSQMVYTDGTLIILDEDGDLALATVTAGGLRVHARSPLMASNSWTPPTLVGTTLYLRDRKNILAVSLGE